ncbi:hypothetical protein Nepgr_024822 [Nepenthes gracilis]|uniref:Protein root UVB sensitive 5 n=1 Tax=Nepenthes gracilis TaxID=150966 RepID=A0AAD3Y0E8_NEPGR|nr:hypothetical protein Nepgr_024822 [Nepenthes gracilis]
MFYALPLSSSTFATNHSSRRHWRKKSCQFRILLSASAPSPQHGENEDCINKEGQGLSSVVLIERYSNGSTKRYVFDKQSRVQTFLEKHASETDKLRFPYSANFVTQLPDFLKDFILPAGFPVSVSDDYLEYMLWQFPTNVTAWICYTLVTSSLLKAVGVGSLPATAAAASAAAIRWVSKDGIGAIGRLIIGGRFGNLFDDDPKCYRMYADFIGSAGSIFDLSTQLYPTFFLPLASLGNLSKAVARGLKDPSVRVIQNHFAVSGNLGDVAAKEEVWEVSAQLVGLAFGVLILDTPSLTSYPVLVLTWMSMRLFHLWLRYQSLSVLQFKTINFKRACVLAKFHVSHSMVPGLIHCNREENILSWQRFLKPRIIFGVSLEEIIAVEKSLSMVKTILKLYAKEKFVLLVNSWQEKAFEVSVCFKRGATSLSALRSIWQAYWLYENRMSENMNALLEQSLLKLDDGFDNFIQQLNDAGWETHEITLKVPKEPLIEELDPVFD